MARRRAEDDERKAIRSHSNHVGSEHGRKATTNAGKRALELLDGWWRSLQRDRRAIPRCPRCGSQWHTDCYDNRRT